MVTHISETWGKPRHYLVWQFDEGISVCRACGSDNCWIALYKHAQSKRDLVGEGFAYTLIGRYIASTRWPDTSNYAVIGCTKILGGNQVKSELGISPIFDDDIPF